jgi:3-methyladenine DNA glycosylase/8-oxoguanine DNA glycosylase
VSSEPRTRELSIGRLDVRRALGTGAGPRDPTTWTERSAIWRATRTQHGPATYRVTWGGGQAVATAWGEGAEDVLERMPGLLGLEDDPEAFRPTDPFVSRLMREQPGLRLGRGKRIIEVLLPTILGQRVTTGDAQSAWRRIVFSQSERAPGPNKLWLPPAPERLRRLRTFEIMGDDLDRKRAATLLRACVHYKKLDARQHLPPAELAAFLCKIPGIGPWTANKTVAETHGWADAVIVGDYHIPHSVAFALAGEPRGTDARMLELLEPFAGHRYRVLRLIGASERRAPSYGPRRASWGFYVDRGTRRGKRHRSKKV